MVKSFPNISFSVAIFSGEVKSRMPKTLNSINSINIQTYSNIQKILINGGSPPHQTSELINNGANLVNWVVIDFPIDTMEAQTGPSHKWNGQAALHASTGDYFFSMNDDDFLQEDFFERMAKLFIKYPTAVSGMGLPIVYDYDSNSFGTKPICIDKKGNLRPEFEPGIEVVKKIFFSDRNSYQPCLGFQPVFKINLVRDVATTIFDNGFPDYSSYFQVVARGDAVFDSKALMYWGKHSSQNNVIMTNRNHNQPHYAKKFQSYSKVNRSVFNKYLPEFKKESKRIKKYFKKTTILATLHSLKYIYNVRLKSRNRSFSIVNLSGLSKREFFLLTHLWILITNPVQTGNWFIKKFCQNKVKYRS